MTSTATASAFARAEATSPSPRRTSRGACARSVCEPSTAIASWSGNGWAGDADRTFKSECLFIRPGGQDPRDLPAASRLPPRGFAGESDMMAEKARVFEPPRLRADACAPRAADGPTFRPSSTPHLCCPPSSPVQFEPLVAMVAKYL